MAEGRHAASPARPAPGTASAVAPVLMSGLGVLIVFGAAARIDWTLTSRFTLFDQPRSSSPTPVAAPSSSDLELPQITPLPGSATVFAILAALVALVLLVALGRYLWSIRPQRVVAVVEPAPVPLGVVSVEEQAAALRRGALSALELLEEIPDPQDAVIRSWLALEQAAVSSGAPRRPADSPTEFVRGLLHVTGADPAASTQLLRLYHRARFSAHQVGLADVQQARTCVAALAKSLDGYEDALRRSVGSRAGSENRGGPR